MMYDTIVIPIDRADHATAAIQPAADLAEACNATVVPIGEPPDVERHRVTLAEQLGGDVAPLYLAADEDPVAAVADTVADLPNPLIVMATHARGRLGHALFGSIAEEILQTEVCPVMLVGPNVDPRWVPGQAAVVVPLDGSDEAELALPLACEWSDRFGGPLDLVRVADASRGQIRPEPSLGLPSHQIGIELPGPALVPAGRAEEPTTPVAVPEAETYLRGQANLLRVQGFEVTEASRPGRTPAGTINEHLDQVDPNLVVTVARCRTGLERLIAGSTTMAVARRATCPVLTRAVAGATQRPPLHRGLS